jgi:ABC-type sugar transport system ATPase subunit
MDQTVGELSGGNQQKVVLAKWLMTSPDILFLDEPTRGIDIGAKVEIYHWIQRLASQGIGIVVASSEMPELIGICHRILVLREGQLSAEFPADQVTQEDIMRAASL